MDPYEQKIADADYFFRQMCQVGDSSREDFTRQLSAFISSSRSVLQYGLRETKGNAEKKNAYLDLLKKHEVVEFFKDIRDLDIHERPVSPKAHVRTLVVDLVRATSGVVSTEEDEARWMDPTYEPIQQDVILIKTVESTTVDYRFHDWPGPENVIALCDIYMIKIKQIISAARADGLIRAI
ncbi:hypothetical protein [Phytopseudomonas daroniae]|uniref:hypothetical protein n=1 Tax=Phytopseudomonas daroniae TaxID=2487519 RepID=UPI0010385125|nr:hypothetical protein [Pseudomonas daroniae]TBU75195.1 hypothetical protein DNK10_11095 [Pseudomonas daroniae]